MKPPPAVARGLYFEDFQVGHRIATPGRTVTEADVVSFAGLSGDYEALHTNAVFAQSTPFGQRIAHGLLGLSMASGLAMRTGFLEGTVLAFREIKDWKFIRPVFIGDTIQVQVVIEEAKPVPRLGGGLLTAQVDLLNQKGETVMKGHWIILVRSRPA